MILRTRLNRRLTTSCHPRHHCQRLIYLNLQLANWWMLSTKNIPTPLFISTPCSRGHSSSTGRPSYRRTPPVCLKRVSDARAVHHTATADTISTVIHPLLYAQEAALIEHLNPYAEPSNPVCGWFEGELSVEAFKKALEWLTDTQTALRTTSKAPRRFYGQIVQTEWPVDKLQIVDVQSEEEAICKPTP